MIRLNHLTEEFKDIVSQANSILEENKDKDEKEAFLIAFNNLDTIPIFRKLVRRWNSSCKIKTWYSKRVEEVTETITIELKEKALKEKAEKEKKDGEETKKEEPKEETKIENPEEEEKEEKFKEDDKKEKLEGGTKEQKTEEDKKEEIPEEDEKEDIINTETEIKIDPEKIEKKLQPTKSKLVKNVLEKAELLMKINIPPEWNQEEKTETQPEKDSLMKKDSDKEKPKKRQSSMLLSLLDKGDNSSGDNKKSQKKDSPDS